MIFQKLGVFGAFAGRAISFFASSALRAALRTRKALASAGSPFPTVYAAGYREPESQVGGSTGNPHPPKLKSAGCNGQHATGRRRRSSPR